MEDSLLDISQDDLLVKETQQPNGDLPVTLSKHLVDHFGIIGHNIKTSSETVNPIYSKRFFVKNLSYSDHEALHCSYRDICTDITILSPEIPVAICKTIISECSYIYKAKN